MSMTGTCYHCHGQGWVSDGTPDDGMMSGRMKCPAGCKYGQITEAQLNAHIEAERLLFRRVG